MIELFARWFPGGSGLTAGDFFIFALLLAAMGILGWAVGRRVLDEEDYLLGGRKIPAWAAGIGLAAAEISALTVIGLPAAAFRGDWTYLQFFWGAAVARIFVAGAILPLLLKAGGATPYAWLEVRFGPRMRAAGAWAFIATRLSLSSVRLLAAAAAGGAMMGWGIGPVMILVTIVAVLALARGGAPAAVWTGVFQAAVVMGVGALSILFLFRRIDGGLGGVWSLTSAAGKLTMFDFGLAPASDHFFRRLFGDPPIFWGAVLSGFLGSAASFGADHEMTQKLLSTSDARAGARAMAVSVAGSFAAMILYMSVGTLLFVYYKQNPGMALPSRVDQILAHFAATAMPRVMRGLVLGAIVLASIDLPLASLSAGFRADLIKARLGASRPGAELRSLRWTAAIFGALTAALAFGFSESSSLLSAGFKFGAVCSGPLLGIFLFGTLSRLGRDREALISFLAAVALDAAMLALCERDAWALGWGWILPIGAAVAGGSMWWLSRPQANARQY